MLNRFLQHTRKPQGTLGRMMLKGMNAGHSRISAWGISHLSIKHHSHILDVGCGGGANIAAMLENHPDCIVDGLDYSEESVAVSQKTNAKALGKRCNVTQGNVASIPYADDTLDYVTAFETIYFWPSLKDAFIEIKRVLKSDGTFFICCESDDADDTTWTSRIEGMTVYRGDDLKELLLSAGFNDVQLDRNESGWICIIASCG